MKRYLVATFSLAALSLAALSCQRRVPEVDPPVPAPTILLEAAPVSAAQPAPAADTAALVAGNTEFALDLYRRLNGRSGNLAFSPYSLSTALAMTYAGARGETASQMAKALHFALPPEQLHPAYASLIQKLQEGKGYELHVANALWGQKGLVFEPSFTKVLQADYGAGLGTVDFAGQRDVARLNINAWIRTNTHGQIPELLGANVLDHDSRLVLTNAVYFQAAWTDPFPKEATRDQPFFLSKTDKADVPMMRRTGDFSYAEVEGVQILRLPYRAPVDLVAFLPRLATGLADLEKTLSFAWLQKHLALLSHQPVTVELPHFKVRTEFSLKEQLAALGMPLAFSREADFSGLTLQDKVHLSAVIHQATMEVDENGTVATAASAVEFKSEGAPRTPRQPVAFRADHPFLFLIRDARSGAILFLGRLTDPRAQ